MKVTVQNETYGEIVYDENFFTGKKSISMGGVPLEKVSKKEFKMQDGESVAVTGSFLGGASIFVKGQTIQLSPKVKWYEIVLCILPILLTLTWGNIPALVAIVPIVGGAIGGAIGGFFSVLGLFCMRLVKPVWLKAIIAVASLAITFGICAGIGYAILSTIM